MLVIFFWVLSVLEDLGVGDKSSGKLRRALCTLAITGYKVRQVMRMI